MNCTNCGSEIKDGELFCGECGAKVESGKDAVPEVQQQKNRVGESSKKKNPMMIPMIGFAVILIICFAGLGITNANREKIDAWDKKKKEESQKIFKKNLEDTKKNFKMFGDTLDEVFGISDKISKLVDKLSNVAMQETDRGIQLSIQNIQFKPNSNELVEEDKARIADVAEALKQIEGYDFLVVGHTADDGSDTSGDVALSLARANTVIAEIANAGIDAKRFMASGAGCSEPIADNSTAEGRARNRRVEITILTK